jgi:hypothetical protein
MKRNLKRVAKFAEEGPFTDHQLRWWIFKAPSNGLDDLNAVVRISRGVYIDVDAFERWIQKQNNEDGAVSAANLLQTQFGKRNGGAAETAAEVSGAAGALATATQSWACLAPHSVAEIDAVSNQLEGCRRALRELRLVVDAARSPLQQ